MTNPRRTLRTREERQRSVENAIHSAKLAGGDISEETRADMDEYVAGLIDSDELVRRGQARYGGQ